MVETISVICNNKLDNENRSRCNQKMNSKEHGQFISNPRGLDENGIPLDERFEMGCIKFTCPACRSEKYVCNICTDDSGHSSTGYINGGTTGKTLSCDNCNAKG